MNKNTLAYKQAVKLGESLIGKKARSRMLTEISKSGHKILCAPQTITGYEIVECDMEPQVMAIIDGTLVFEDLLIY